MNREEKIIRKNTEKKQRTEKNKKFISRISSLKPHEGRTTNALSECVQTNKLDTLSENILMKEYFFFKSSINYETT